MVIDCAKGVEQRTIKLMEVCRLRQTPIFTFINKLDREGREPIELLDEVESVLGIQCAPITWPIGMGKRLKGVYHLLDDAIHLYESGKNYVTQQAEIIQGIDNPLLDERLGPYDARSCATKLNWSKAPAMNLIRRPTWTVIRHRCFLVPPSIISASHPCSMPS